MMFWTPSEPAKAVADLLAHDPGGWTVDNYVAHHPAANIAIWIANDDYGLHWWLGDRDGYGRCSRFGRPNGRDRRHVYRALQHLRQEPALVTAAKQAIAKVDGGAE